MKRLLNVAKKFAQKLDKETVVEEHKTNEVSYMVFKNLDNIISDAQKLKSIMNDKDDLPAWADEQISLSKNNLSKVLDYVSSEKTNK